MVLTLSVLLWVFHVASSSQQVDLKDINCGGSDSTTSEMSYLIPLVCQSGCRPRETLVNVWKEFPEEMHHTIFPCSVPVQRCAGYCGDEATVCVPVENYTVLVQVQRVGDHPTMIELPFVQHSGCSCRSRKCLTGPLVHC